MSGEMKYIANQVRTLIENGVDPDDIAVISYTRAELEELKEELEKFSIQAEINLPQAITES